MSETHQNKEKKTKGVENPTPRQGNNKDNRQQKKKYINFNTNSSIG